MKLNKEQHEQFDRDGYLFFPGLFTPDEARQAGRKGGESVSRNREHMAAIGRRGGAARSLSMQRRQPAPPSSPRTASA